MVMMRSLLIEGISVQNWTYILVGLTFALYIGIAIYSRASSTKEFYVAGGGVSPLANGMATAADWMSAASFISMAGIILTVISLIIYPTALMLGFLVAHILLYMLFRRVAAKRRPKSWGIVFDEKSKKPLKHAIVRVFDILRERGVYIVGNVTRSRFLLLYALFVCNKSQRFPRQ